MSQKRKNKFKVFNPDNVQKIETKIKEKPRNSSSKKSPRYSGNPTSESKRHPQKKNVENADQSICSKNNEITRNSWIEEKSQSQMMPSSQGIFIDHKETNLLII